ncbi:MAG: arsenite methyltransferase [Myxococcales bacterium]|nr:arsenite methyltransferase [Myxococcales bacterium]
MKDDEKIRQTVRENYGRIVSSQSSCCCGPSTGCCEEPVTSPKDQAHKLGYGNNELDAVPDGANLGLGCGNPQAVAELTPGEVVLDLGSGAGFDCFIAARAVAPNGCVIGVDMTPEMLAKARENAQESGVTNVEFRLGEIEHLPVADNSVDVILSNCVINLSPNKPAVFAEAYRVLKPGGRLAISDVLATKRLPEHLIKDAALLCGCVAGAATVEDVIRILKEVGFANVRIEVKPESRSIIADWFPGSGAEEYVASAIIQATKP